MFYCFVKSFVRNVPFENIIRTPEVSFFGGVFSGNVLSVLGYPVCMVHSSFLMAVFNYGIQLWGWHFFPLQWKHLYVGVSDAWDSWADSKELFCSFPFICFCYGHADFKLRMTLWWELTVYWMNYIAWMSVFVKSIPVLQMLQKEHFFPPIILLYSLFSPLVLILCSTKVLVDFNK